MEIFGIGFSELVFALVIALLVLGPKDMEKTARMIGEWLNRLLHSDTWRAYRRIRTLPNEYLREMNLKRHLQEAAADKDPESAARSAVHSKPYPPVVPQETLPENQIAPPTPKKDEGESGPRENA